MTVPGCSDDVYTRLSESRRDTGITGKVIRLGLGLMRLTIGGETHRQSVCSSAALEPRPQPLRDPTAFSFEYRDDQCRRMNVSVGSSEDGSLDRVWIRSHHAFQNLAPLDLADRS